MKARFTRNRTLNSILCMLAYLFAAPILLFTGGVLSANAYISRRQGNLQSYLVEDNVHIYKGALVVINTSGYALPGADTSGYRFVGVAAEEADNTVTGHSQGGISVKVWTDGEHKLTATSITQAMVGQMMFLVDDATVDDVTVTNRIPVGILTEYISATQGWVSIQEALGEDVVIVNSPAAVNRGGDADWAGASGGLSLPTNSAAKTAYVPITGLQVGDIVTAYTVHAGVGAKAGLTTTLDANLYSSVAKAGGTTETDLGAIAQVSVVADTLVASSKTLAAASPVVANMEYYAKLTGTTANDAACDILVTGITLTVKRKRG